MLSREHRLVQDFFMSKGRRESFIAAERMRAYRERRRNGLRCMRILLHETELCGILGDEAIRRRGLPAHR